MLWICNNNLRNNNDDKWLLTMTMVKQFTFDRHFYNDTDFRSLMYALSEWPTVEHCARIMFKCLHLVKHVKQLL